MRKRIISVVLVFALAFALSISASAGSISDSGITYNPNGLALQAGGNLLVENNYATATTWNSKNLTSLCHTVVTVYYIGSNNSESQVTQQGQASVTALASLPYRATRGGSHHLVAGGAEYGSWSCTLRVDS